MASCIRQPHVKKKWKCCGAMSAAWPMACVSATRAKHARCVHTSVIPHSKRMHVNMGGALTLYSIQRCGTRDLSSLL